MTAGAEADAATVTVVMYENGMIRLVGYEWPDAEPDPLAATADCTLASCACRDATWF